DDRYLRLKGGADRRFAGTQHADLAEGIDGGHAGVVRVEPAQPGDVAPVALLELRADEELLPLARLERAVSGQHLQSLRQGFVLPRTGSAGGNPVEKELILATALAEQLAASVRRSPRRLEQQQTVLGAGGVDASTVELTRQADMVPVGGVTSQRQFEAV